MLWNSVNPNNPHHQHYNFHHLHHMKSQMWPGNQAREALVMYAACACRPPVCIRMVTSDCWLAHARMINLWAKTCHSIFLITQQPASMNQQEYAVQILTLIAESCSNVTLATDAVMSTLKAHKQTHKTHKHKHTHQCGSEVSAWLGLDKNRTINGPEGSLYSAPYLYESSC